MADLANIILMHALLNIVQLKTHFLRRLFISAHPHFIQVCPSKTIAPLNNLNHTDTQTHTLTSLHSRESTHQAARSFIATAY